MIFNEFIHGDGEGAAGSGTLFRSTVSQFVNDTDTHPIIKYQAFIVAGLLIVSGLLILLLFNGERIFSHSYWRHLFIPLSDVKDKHRVSRDADADADADVFGYDYDYRDINKMSDAAIFREAVEGMTSSSASSTTKDGKATTKSGEFLSADTEAAEKKKKTPCATDCGQYVELKGKINELSKYVDAVKDQKDEIKQTGSKLQALGKQIEDLNKSLSPGGQLNITI
jgi:hypothetical protein